MVKGNLAITKLKQDHKISWDYHTAKAFIHSSSNTPSPHKQQKPQNSLN